VPAGGEFAAVEDGGEGVVAGAVGDGAGGDGGGALEVPEVDFDGGADLVVVAVAVDGGIGAGVGEGAA
jgi:hypothetical protein